MFKTLSEDIDAVFERDPAVRSRLEVVLCYPGFHAVLLYRMANALWRRRAFLVGRLISHFGRMVTGIEIHPGAMIGNGFFIDHGMGVVIGETSIIGDGVTLYHDVTLGGIAPSVGSERQIEEKRHPTLEDGVIVGSGAQILGPIIVGSGARVGANSVVLKDVAPDTTVVGIPAKLVAPKPVERVKRFDAYGTPGGEAADPVVKMIDDLNARIVALSGRVAELESEDSGTGQTVKLPLDQEQPDSGKTGRRRGAR